MNKLTRETVERELGESSVRLIPRSNSPRILHLGAGVFHRSHQAFYIQKLIDQDPTQVNWQIQGVCIMPGDQQFVNAITQQDGLYSLRSVNSEGHEELTLISSLAGVWYGPDNSQLVIDTIASAETKIISFTITEGGYFYNTLTGAFDLHHVDVAHDLKNRTAVPRTVFGYLARGLEARMTCESPKIVLMSCDNLQENGKVLKSALVAFLQAYNPAVLTWLEENVTFPNSMVDRITPRLNPSDVEKSSQLLGLLDEVPVVSEDFIQWVLERPSEDFEFPPLDLVGVQFVEDVRPYENMKLGILNGGHSLVGLFGDHLGYSFIHESIKDAWIAQRFDEYMNMEVIPALEPIDGVDYREYADIIKRRFSNAMLNDTNARIISDSSAKFPKFILPVLIKNMESGGATDVAISIIVSWWSYLKRMHESGREGEIQDPLAPVLIETVRGGVDDFLNFLRIDGIFGSLSTDPIFVEKCKASVDRLISSEN